MTEIEILESILKVLLAIMLISFIGLVGVGLKIIGDAIYVGVV